ncbi:uncharacterized protein LOC129364246 isoform X2 [Poeciliopsis prolifica]|uniref:uncharacterized protein LOC129364246 isoform X2 n=1 Tax=Poeciliopsis prolifica TaxID=188132 RepID=UPI0024133872|nr:uncharacterized protein LOC129364246 isoform X2 [Poeciliopsis prolifica]
MASFQLLVFLGCFATAQAAIDLECFNDYEKIFCQLGVEQCSQYTLRVDDDFEKFNPSLEKCNGQQCCFSTTFEPVSKDYSVKVFQGKETVRSTTFDVLKTLKPKTPTIVTVNKSGMIYTVNWMTHMSDILGKLTAEVTVFKNGTPWKEFKEITPATVDGQESFQINGQDLEPETVYTVSVRSYTDYSQKFSDRSNEYEIKTPSAPNSLVLWIIIPPSIFGIILIVSIYICFVRIKKKWWDSFSEPKKLSVSVGTPQFFKPHDETTSPVRVQSFPSKDDDQMSPIKQREDGSMNGNSSGGSSDLCYGQTETLDPNSEDFAKIINKSLLECLSKHFIFTDLHIRGQGHEASLCPSYKSGKAGIFNRTYFPPLPKTLNLTKENCSGVKFPDNSINSCKSNTVGCPDQQIPAGLLSAQKGISSDVRVDMSYQKNKANANQSPLSENSSLSSTFSGTTTTTSSGFHSSNGSILKRFNEENPDVLKMLSPSSLPSGTCHCPVVVDDYKPFRSKVEHPGVLPSENQSIDHQRLNVIEGERFLQVPKMCFTPDLRKWNGPCPSVPQIPHLPLLSSDMAAPVVVVDGYKCV